MENKLIRQLLPDKGVMLDIGACHGKSHVPFWGWDIYAFEPDPDNARHISSHQGVKVYDIAISDQDDSAPFYRTPMSHGMSSLLPFFPSHEICRTVKVRRLDTLLPELSVTWVDYMKIDTEGYDLMVLQGFPWDTMQPQVVMCEFGNSKTELLGYTHDDLARFMLKLGYRVIMSEWIKAERINGRYQHKWLGYFHYPPPPERVMWWGNLIFVNDSDIYNQLCERMGLK